MLSFWENIILQWVNCLCDYHIKEMEELEDGKVYYKLINKAMSNDYQTPSNCEKQMIQKFLKDEYPNITINNCGTALQNVYTGLLLMCKLSLEPIFLKSLIVNHEQDFQIKIKTISAIINSFGKDIIHEDVNNILQLFNQMDTKSFLQKSIYMLNSSENIISRQSKELKNFKIEIDTLCYEKSQLTEDIKAQRIEAEILKSKLQTCITELNLMHNNKIDETDSLIHYSKTVDARLVESFYEKELRSLENYVTELQTVNRHLKEENHFLIDKVKNLKEKYRLSRTKSLQNQEVLLSALFEIEKSHTELIDLKIEYEDLRNYLIEKSKSSLDNKIFSAHDDTVFNTSLNASETLSSVIEIQLLDARKEIHVLQNVLKKINIIFTIILEEYEKLKLKINSFPISLTKIKHVNKETSINIKEINYLDPKSIEIEVVLSKSKFDLRKSKFMVRKNHRIELYMSIFLNILNRSDAYKNLNQLKKNLQFQSFKGKPDNLFRCKASLYNHSVSDNISKILSSLKILNLNEERKRTNCLSFHNLNCNHSSFFLKFGSPKFTNDDYLIKINDSFVLLEIINVHKYYLKMLPENCRCINCILINAYSVLPAKKKMIILPYILNGIVKNINIESSENEKCILGTYISNTCIYLPLLQQTWISINQNIINILKMYKLIIMMQRILYITCLSSGEVASYSFYSQPRLEQFLKKKYKIEHEISDIYFNVVHIFGLNLISAMKFIVILNSIFLCELKNVYTGSEKTKYLNKLLINTWINYILGDGIKINRQHQNYIMNKIVGIKAGIDNFDSFIKISEIKGKSNNSLINETRAGFSLLSHSNRKKILKLKKSSPNFSDKRAYYLVKLQQSTTSKKKYVQFHDYLSEIHKKYEIKLARMKDKMKYLYNNQIKVIRREQNMVLIKKLEMLQKKIQFQCYEHTEELNKYKMHISELTTQLWNIGEKLIIEKQIKEDFIQKLNILKTKYESVKIQCARLKDIQLQRIGPSNLKVKINTRNVSKLDDKRSFNRLQDLQRFELMENIFKTEDEEGEIFDTTSLSEVQAFQDDTCKNNFNRLSILQKRNFKCKPHLKSSYPTELEFLHMPVTEDEIKTGYVPDELLDNSLSQSLLTGEKVKRKDRLQNVADTQRRSNRISSIFRKHRFTTDHK